MHVLAIETSCDETSLALVEIGQRSSASPARSQTFLPNVKVLKNIVSSQVKIHAPFGGVVPSLAKREHIKNLPLIWKQFLKHPIIKKKKVDLLTVTVGPGLEPALWTGITFAKELHENYFEKRIPLVGANHLHGHLYSFLLTQKGISNFQFPISNQKKLFPMISLIVSGGHTILGVLKNLNSFKKLGETKDDAVGECFDKVARLLELPYPGGPKIEKLAQKSSFAKATEDKRERVQFPSPMIHQKNYDFSYSGLKTAVLYYLRDAKYANNTRMSRKKKADIAASFQGAAFKVLVKKTMRAVGEYGAESISIGGGVAASKELRRLLNHETRLPQTEAKLRNPIQFIVPPFEYCMDNAAMIAVAGYMAHKNKIQHPLKANGILNL